MTDDIREIKFIPFLVPLNDLVSVWIEMMHPEDHVLVIYDPVTHIDYLKKNSLIISDLELYNSKILTNIMSNFDDAMWLCINIEGPYCQIYSQGRYITDNIDK